jgi:hypothetical protein
MAEPSGRFVVPNVPFMLGTADATFVPARTVSAGQVFSQLPASVNLIDLRCSAEPLRGLRATAGPRRIRLRTCGTR